MTDDIILLAHGARNPRWAEPFYRLRDKVRAGYDSGRVELAFISLMVPSLIDVAEQLIARGSCSLLVSPLLLGAGSHATDEQALGLDELRTRHPAVSIRMMPVLGESEAVLDGMMEWVLGMSGINRPDGVSE